LFQVSAIMYSCFAAIVQKANQQRVPAGLLTKWEEIKFYMSG